MLKLKTPQTMSPSNADLAPLPERRRSTFREPAAEVDLGLFGLAKQDLEVDGAPDLAVAPAVAAAPDVAATPTAPDVDAAAVPPAAADEPGSIGVPEVTEAPVVATAPVAPDVPEVTEAPVVATGPVSPDAPEVAPSRQRARHRADRAGNRRAAGSNAFRAAMPAH